MKKFWKRFFEIFTKFVEKCGKFLYKFLSILMKILYCFYVNFWQKLWAIVGKYAIIGIDIDIDTREKYWYLSIQESIEEYRYFSHHYYSSYYFNLVHSI